MSDRVIQSMSASLPTFVQTALTRLPPEAHGVVSAIGDAVGPLISVEAAEADAAEAAAATAKDGEAAATVRAGLAVAALEALQERERARALQVIVALEDASEGERSFDYIARLLDVGAEFETAEAFGAFMDDHDLPMRLGPPPKVDVDHAARLSRVARPVDEAPIGAAATAELRERFARNRLDTRSSAGRWSTGASAPSILLGDGSAVTLLGGLLVRIRDAGGAQETLEAQRLASGRPAQLEPHASAAYAACLAARDAPGPADAMTLPLWLTTGVAVRTETDRGCRGELLSAVRALRGVRAPEDAAVPLLQIAFDVSRVRGHLAAAPTSSEPTPMIDVGRVLWCELSQRPVFWLPMFGEHPDTVGGPDRAWTTDIPAAGAQWHRSSPALRTDPEWSAALVVAPGHPNVWCIDQSGGWWSLDTNYEALVLARRARRETWCDAIEWLHEQMPAQIAFAERRAAALKAQRHQAPRTNRSSVGQSEIGEQTDGESDDGPRDLAPRFSRAWVEELAGRYDYQSDDAAEAAGAAAARRGYYAHDEFLTVVQWKSKRVIPLAETNTAGEVHAKTRAAFATTNELERIAALISLHGVGVPVASALLQFAYPDRYPILDFRALEALGDFHRRTTYGNEFWVEYVERCRKLARDAGVSVRDLDKALWQASREGDTRR